MKRISLAVLLISASWLAAPAAQASTHVSRCSTADGGTTYTDGSCRAVGGQPVPLSANLLGALAREGVLGGDRAFRPPPAAASTATAVGSGARNRLGEASCPRSPAQLASALRNSLGGGDVSRLASLYDWTGKSSREARPILARLERMSEKPLIDGQYFRGGLDGEGGTVQLVQGAKGAATVTEVPVNRRAGCLLLAL